MIVMVLTCPVTVITDVMGVGVQVLVKEVAGFDGARTTAAAVVDAVVAGVTDVEDVLVDDNGLGEEELA